MKKSKNNKKINTELNFEGYKDALETAFKRFLDAPTNKSLKDFIDYSQNYREAWILKNAAPGYQDNFEQGRDVRHSNADVKDPRVDVDPMILHVDELSKQFVKETVFKADSDNREEGKDGGSSIASNYFIWPQLEQDYLQHSILGTRPSNSKDWKKGKLLNRRWYFEKEHPNAKKTAWWTSREDFSTAARKANEQKMFLKKFNNLHVDADEFYTIYSDDLSDEEKIKYFNEITLPNERDSLINSDINFVIVESVYPKTPRQFAEQTMNPGSKYTWRDVCIFDPQKITFRSLTNDFAYKPAVRIVDNPGWLISNDMLSTSNQTMIEFLKYTDRRLKIHNELNDK